MSCERGKERWTEVCEDGRRDKYEGYKSIDRVRSRDEDDRHQMEEAL